MPKCLWCSQIGIYWSESEMADGKNYACEKHRPNYEWHPLNKTIQAIVRMKLNIECDIDDARKVSITTSDDVYGCRHMILPSNLAIKIYEAIEKELV